MAFSPDGKLAASAGDPVSAGDALAPELWDVASGLKVRTFISIGGSQEIAQKVIFSPDGHFVLSAASATMSIWDVASGTELRRLAARNVRVIAFSPNGRLAISGGCDEEERDDVELIPHPHCLKVALKLWNVATGEEVHSFDGHKDWVTAAAFSPDGRFLLSSSEDNTLKLWDVLEWTQPQEARR